MQVEGLRDLSGRQASARLVEPNIDDAKSRRRSVRDSRRINQGVHLRPRGCGRVASTHQDVHGQRRVVVFHGVPGELLQHLDFDRLFEAVPRSGHQQTHLVRRRCVGPSELGKDQGIVERAGGVDRSVLDRHLTKAQRRDLLEPALQGAQIRIRQHAELKQGRTRTVRGQLGDALNDLETGLLKHFVRPSVRDLPGVQPPTPCACKDGIQTDKKRDLAAMAGGRHLTTARVKGD